MFFFISKLIISNWGFSVLMTSGIYGTETMEGIFNQTVFKLEKPRNCPNNLSNKVLKGTFVNRVKRVFLLVKKDTFVNRVWLALNGGWGQI